MALGGATTQDWVVWLSARPLLHVTQDILSELLLMAKWI